MTNPTPLELGQPGVVEVDPHLIDWFRLECIELGQDWRLRRIDGATCDDIELVLGVKLKNAYLVFVSADLPDEAAAEILDLEPKKVFAPKTVQAILNKHEVPSTGDVRQEFTYVYTERAKDVDLGGVTAMGDTIDWFDAFVSVPSDSIVARAWSIRRDDTAAQLAIHTVPGHQHHAEKCVAAWVEAQLAARKVPFISFRKGNNEARTVAQITGAEPLAEILSYY